MRKGSILGPIFTKSSQCLPLVRSEILFPEGGLLGFVPRRPNLNVGGETWEKEKFVQGRRKRRCGKSLQSLVLAVKTAAKLVSSNPYSTGRKPSQTPPRNDQACGEDPCQDPWVVENSHGVHIAIHTFTLSSHHSIFTATSKLVDRHIHY
jgi:hypothetical protein